MNRPGAPAGFDFTLHVRRLCEDIVQRVPDLRHVDMGRVAVRFCQARRTTPSGVYASLTPLRLAGGRSEVVRSGQTWTIQRLVDPSGREMLYLLSLYLPRFANLPLREKLTTLVHELWHVGPRFDGDLRRYRGRCFAHGSSRKGFDEVARRLTDEWLSRQPPEPLYAFLQGSFHDLVARHGSVFGTRIPSPRLIPVA